MEQQLFEAVKAGKVAEVRSLVQARPALSGARDANGVSAILTAIYHRRPDVASALVEMGAPIDIFEASALGKVDRITALLSEDPSLVSAYAQDGFYPVGLAAFFGHRDAVHLLIAAGANVHAAARNAFKVQAIHAAAASRDLEIVRAVLEAGADPNVPQQQGALPLHEAAKNGNRAMAELLVTHGADPMRTNDEGKNSIDYARENGHTDLAEWMEPQRGQT